VALYHHQTKSGRYELGKGPPLRRLRGQTLGIVGLGRIGRTLAAKAGRSWKSYAGGYRKKRLIRKC
jgi:phosphoglycerate dehydrogenase-like enzyme